MITNHVLPIKRITLEVQVRMVKPNAIQKLDGMNIIKQLKAQNHWNTLKATPTTALLGLSFQMLQKMVRRGRAQKCHIMLLGNLILPNKGLWKTSFILKCCHIEQLMTYCELPKRKCFFFSFQFVVLSLIAVDN